MHIPKYTTS